MSAVPTRLRAIAKLLLCIPIMLMTSCYKLPSKAEIQRDFLATEPQAKIISVRFTEGDEDHSYYDIEFTRGSSPEVMICEMGARTGHKGSAYTIFHRSVRAKTARP